MSDTKRGTGGSPVMGNLLRAGPPTLHLPFGGRRQSLRRHKFARMESQTSEVNRFSLVKSLTAPARSLWMGLKRVCSLILIVVLSCPSLAEPANPGSKPPNIVLILADDLGYGDLGVTGSKQIPTPHIDSLATEGTRFTNAYVTSAVCAPSRAGLMTGKHPVTFGFRDNLAPVQPGHDPEFVGLPLGQATLAERLKKLGYKTGIVGKWHLGELPKFSPLQRGFDEFWGYTGGAHDYFRAEPDGDKSMAGPILCNYKQAAPLTLPQWHASIDQV